LGLSVALDDARFTIEELWDQIRDQGSDSGSSCSSSQQSYPDNDESEASQEARRLTGNDTENEWSTVQDRMVILEKAYDRASYIDHSLISRLALSLSPAEAQLMYCQCMIRNLRKSRTAKEAHRILDCLRIMPEPVGKVQFSSKPRPRSEISYSGIMKKPAKEQGATAVTIFEME
jgi:hypothetical protein